MPPVRWKTWFCVMAIFVQVAFVAATQQMQDSISMSSDGWRPIVGTRRQQPTKPESEITQYANPIQNVEVIPAEVLNIEATTLPYSQNSAATQKVPVKNSGIHKERKQGAKVKLPHKTTGPYYLPSGSYQSTVSGSQQFKKVQGMKKTVLVPNKPRKPVRGQALAHSSRNEVFVPPPPQNTSGYSIVKSVSPSNIKTREAQGFGLIGNNFGLSQQNAHIELARFPLTGESILQRPTFFLAKPLQNDEFTRNLVPPPRGRIQQKGKGDTKISLYAFKEGPATDATSNIPQFGARPNQFLPQVHPTFEFSSQQQKPKSQQIKEEAVDVQITKENLRQYVPNGGPVAAFGAIPSRNNFPIGYVDYDFQRARSPNAPNTLTYEVTEGKFLDTPSQQYQFRPQNNFQFQFQNLRQAPPNARPGLLFQGDVSTARPPVFQAPLVDLSVPGFLPTPYKPESGVIPTSPTQSEVATVFAQVSNKMNRDRNNALKENPLFFDIKDVSTHYPILGTPEAQSEGGTDTPLPMNENGEITNEISTTQRERTRRPTKEPTRSTSTRDPTKSRITNRRRPRPKNPSTTTTTEESVVETLDTYEPMKSQENIEEGPHSEETERPVRRRRPKPTAYLPQETYLNGEREPVENKKQALEGTPSRQRVRNRFRNRERPSTERSDTNVIQRKRLRPAYFESIKQTYEETTESSVEPEQFSSEREPSSDQTYSQETSQSDEAANSQQNSQRFETEVPTRHYETVQEQPARQENKPFIEEIHPVTERVKVYERTRTPITSTAAQESSTHFHIPENEVDYTTQSQIVRERIREDITTTTSQPTTTAEITTTTSNRIRRPSKYDSSNRPRFSVKDYRQRLNQYTSTTPSSTTTQTRNTPDNIRLRFPNRVRTRPTPTTASSRADEDIIDETTATTRTKFKPKDPRYQTTTESGDLVITEKSVKSINTRLRPFGRSKSTTEATTSAPKVSIRTNLFSARRRAGYPSLKSRIQNKLKKNETEEESNDIETTTSSHNEVEDVEPLNVAESATTEISSTTEIKFSEQTTEEASTEFIDPSVTEDIMKNEDFMHSQRVSDLTSSFKDYDKPGIFNSVAPTSRSIPNYFTISTDDPILPIEAFFPSLKEKDKTKER